MLQRGNLKSGSSILIHSGTGGIGLAAIGLALHCGCKVYTTVGTEEKRVFLKTKFPQLKDSEIGNSRDTSFEQMVHRETKGRGVDYVLNSLAEEKLEASIRCLARGGKFLEIGKFDLASNNRLQLLFIEKEASYHGIMLDMFFVTKSTVLEEIAKVLFKLIESGAVVPLPRTVFGKDESEKAFRYMMTGKHMGKVLLQIREEEVERTVTPVCKTFLGLPRYCFFKIGYFHV